MRITLDHLRRYAIARSLFKPTTLKRAIEKLGFVQADPIRAPARAQDLTLRHRVAGYRAGDLERRYPKLPLEEDFFVNYGYMPRAHHQLMHPRTARTVWTPARRRAGRGRPGLHPRARRGASARSGRPFRPRQGHQLVRRLVEREHSIARRHALSWASARGAARRRHPRLCGARSRGGSSGHGRAGSAPAAASSRMDALVDLAVRKYAPLPASTLGQLVRHLRGGAPQWTAQRAETLMRAKQRLAHARIEGIDWYWPDTERPASVRWRPDERVRLLTPFDPIVWDRRRFEIFWGWTYRFEAYTPAPKRKLGYYALPLLWRERVIGWGNVAAAHGRLSCSCGYSSGRAPRDRRVSHRPRS